jgi:hypothetical protein
MLHFLRICIYVKFAKSANMNAQKVTPLKFNTCIKKAELDADFKFVKMLKKTLQIKVIGKLHANFKSCWFYIFIWGFFPFLGKFFNNHSNIFENIFLRPWSY